MNSIHVEAYMETIIDQLQTRDAKDATLAILKKVGLMSGGAFIGTVALGPLGFVIGGGIGSGAAWEMDGPSKSIQDMVLCLRGLDLKQKTSLVRQLEETVGETDTESLVAFCANKDGRDTFLATVCNYLCDQVPLDTSQAAYSARHDVTIPLVKPSHYKQLLDFGQDD